MDQLPRGLRKTLYIKDDDYLLSFMHGNFITLTNIKDSDIKRIIKHRIEPLYISVHSMDPTIREKIFGNKIHGKGLDYLKILDEAGIRTNIQIVLMPGINDGRDLKNTLYMLTNDYLNIESIGIVPVGVTKYNKDKRLRPVEKQLAKAVIDMVKDLRRRGGRRVSGKVFLSDEFYLISGTSFPPFSHYGNFPQINNGIGKSPDFLRDLKIYLNKNKVSRIPENRPGRILLITSEYGINIIRQAIDAIKAHIIKKDPASQGKIIIDALDVKNNFLGGNVKVTGLLSGEDILNTIRILGKDKYNTILIPDSVFNEDGLTLDGYSMKNISSPGKSVKIVPDNGKGLASSILEELGYDGKG